jgi:hypothetical protein
MNDQHAGLSQVLAEQRMTDRRRQASHALGRGIGPPIRRRRLRAPRWELQPVAGGSRPAGPLARWPSIAAQPGRRPRSVS